MKGVVGNADFPQLMLAENSPSPAAAARAGGVPGENYSLNYLFHRNLQDPDSASWFGFLSVWLAIFRKSFCEVCVKEIAIERQNCLTVCKGKSLLLLSGEGIQISIGWVGLNCTDGMISRIASSISMA